MSDRDKCMYGKMDSQSVESTPSSPSKKAATSRSNQQLGDSPSSESVPREPGPVKIGYSPAQSKAATSESQ